MNFFRIIILKLSNFMKPINTEKISVNSHIWKRNLLPKTANELLLDPVDATTTSESEGESTGVVGEGDTIVHYIAGDLCLTGRGEGAKRQNRGGNGGITNWGREGGREGNGSYG